jgi:AAHS family 4-hydroxybenzoate transporter-like MFS transporter
MENRSVTTVQKRVIGLCGLVLLIDAFDTQSMGFLAPPMAEALGIPVTSFGPVFSSGLLGLMLGSLVIGPVADKRGRKPALILSTLVFGIFCLTTVAATQLGELIMLRFLTGLGLGGAIPNAVALASEYAPPRVRAVLVTGIFVGMGGGALLAAGVASFAIPLWGWRSMFYVGGLAPIILSIGLIKLLPESAEFVEARGANQRAPVGQLFREARSAGTILLWVPCFLNLVILYCILSWLPALLRQSGMPVSAGVAAISLFSVGGILACLAQGRVMNRWGAYRIILIEFCVTVVLVAAAVLAFKNYAAIMIITFLLGLCVQGAQAGLNTAAALFYPTSIRATGVGWSLGVGRIGGILSPVLAGVLLQLGWDAGDIFAAGAIPAVGAALSIFYSRRLAAGHNPYPGPRERALEPKESPV